MLHPLIARLMKQQLFYFLVTSSPACLFLDAFRRSLLLLVAVVLFVVSLSVIRCHPSRPFHSLTSASPAVALPPFSCLLRLPVAVVGFLVVLLFRLRPLIRSLQLVVAIVGLPLVFTSASHSQCRLVVVLRVPQESYKSSYRPARYLKQTSCCCAHCNEVVTRPS